MNAERKPGGNVIPFPDKKPRQPAAPQAECFDSHYHAAAIREEAASSPRQPR